MYAARRARRVHRGHRNGGRTGRRGQCRVDLRVAARGRRTGGRRDRDLLRRRGQHTGRLGLRRDLGSDHLGVRGAAA